MKKSLTLLLIVFIAMFMAGIYGVIHDQITFSISEEYYTKFKFIQFGLSEQADEALIPQPRLGAAIVGFLATWWVGFWIGLFVGLTSLFYPDWQTMLRNSIQSFLLVLTTAFIIGLAGLVYGFTYIAKAAPAYREHWYVPDNVISLDSFLAVGSMHNFSYLGGLIGLVLAVARNFWFNFRRRENSW